MFKIDEDPLQCRFYFLTFLESLEMISFLYKENCEVLLCYPKIGGENIKDFVKEAIRNILYANIDMHIRRLISQFPGDGVECIEKLQSYCTNMTFSDKSRYDRIFQKVRHKRGESAINYINISRNAQACQFQWENYSEDQLMLIFLDNFYQGGKYSSQIASHQA